MKYWDTETFWIGEDKRDSSRALTSVTSYATTYRYNELGFRGDSIHKDGFKVMSIGCSHTEGAWIEYQETWPFRFTSKIPNGINLNFGRSAKSCDYVSRALITYFDTIQPDLVLIMYPGIGRREYVREDGKIYNFIPRFKLKLADKLDKEAYHSFVNLWNESEDLNNWYKNHLLIKYFLESKKCNWLWNGLGVPKDYLEFNRFDGTFTEYMGTAKDKMHVGSEGNKIYSEELFEHIFNNFRDYLPEDVNNSYNKIL